MEPINETTKSEMTQFQKIKAEVSKLFADMELDAEKFYVKEQKAAAVRLRKGYKAIKQYIHEVSAETSPKKN